MTMILFGRGVSGPAPSSRLPNRSGLLDASTQLTKHRWIRSIFWIPVLDNVTINQLRAFVAVCDQGSFSGAARKPGRAQSALSHAVKALESAFDAELFERNPRTAQLSAAGRSLVHQRCGGVSRAEEMNEGPS